MIKYVVGDATEPVGPGKKVILHICNDLGVWGAGFVRALSAKDRRPEQDYALARRSVPLNQPIPLGKIIQSPFVDADTFVISMVAQRGVLTVTNQRPVRYDALYDCLEKVSRARRRPPFSVHMPKIGAGLGGGDWNIIEAIIESTLVKAGLEVTVYELPHEVQYAKTGDQD